VKDAKYWFDQPGSPRPKLANEEPKGAIVPYETLLTAWNEGRVKWPRAEGCQRCATG
jgi:glycerol transport system substrate-binding protein